jgi:hypothetical protein
MVCKETLSNRSEIIETGTVCKSVQNRISVSVEDWLEIRKFIYNVCKSKKTKCTYVLGPDRRTRVIKI